MHPAALPGSAGEHRVDGGDRAAVRIGDDQLHPGKAAVAQAAEEAGPEHLVLAVTDVAAEHLAAPVGGHAGGDHHRPGDHPATYPGLAVGGIEEHVRDRLFVQRAAAQAATSPSRPAQIRLTSLLLIPDPTPSAATRSSTLQVDTPSTQACITTACSATSIRRRGASRDGKNDPARTFGIFTVRSPAEVATSFSRVPLRCIIRVSVRSCGPAPMCAVASASMTACSIVSSNRRINSPPSAVRSASLNSSRAD